MQYTSHRLRSQEKKLNKKLVKTVVLIIVGIIAAFQIGLPLLAKIVVGLSFLRKDKGITEKSADSLLFPPVLNSLPEATNSAMIIVSGFTDKNSPVVLTVNGHEDKTDSDIDGRFEFRGVALQEGQNEIEAYLIREDKKRSASSLSIIYKKEPPEINTTEPENGRKFLGEEKSVAIRGTTEKDARVSVNDRFIIVGREGDFEYQT